jgi:16S rRNA (cytosine967-C5)-methyltransferase
VRLAGRAAAAIEIVSEILERRRPASEALKDWGKAHRFAGSGDRHAIGTLVYDVLRQKNSLAWRMGSDTPRALVFAALKWKWGIDPASIAAEKFGPGALTGAEAQALGNPRDLGDAPVHVRGDFPEWLTPSFPGAEEGAALALRAPIDLRVNTLKATREQVLEALARFGAKPGPLSPGCVRIDAPGP